MVLEFKNTVTIHGGNEELREQCATELGTWGSNWCWLSNIGTEASLQITTQYMPLDNSVVDVAMKYLALDFTIEFEPISALILKDWQGCLKVVDQQVYFSDNYEANEGYDLGSIYDISAKGGFPNCLEPFMKR